MRQQTLLTRWCKIFTKKSKVRNVEVTLPDFAVDQDVDYLTVLKSKLPQLAGGKKFKMTSLFAGPLYLQSIRQENAVKLNRLGVNVRSSIPNESRVSFTAIIESSPQPIVELDFDHPFTLLILKNYYPNKAQLFPLLHITVQQPEKVLGEPLESVSLDDETSDKSLEEIKGTEDGDSKEEDKTDCLPCCTLF